MVFLWGWPGVRRRSLNGGTGRASRTALAGISKLVLVEVPVLHEPVYRTRRWCQCPTARTGPPSRRRRSTSSTGSRPRARASSWRRCSRRSGCGSRRAAFCRQFARHAVPRALGAVHDRLHVGPGVHRPSTAAADATLGPGLHAHRLALSVLRAAARLAGRGADRLRHLVQRPVRQPAADHGRAARAQSRC